MVMVLLVLMGWVGSYLVGWKEDCSEWKGGWRDGCWEEGYPRDSSKGDRMRETRRKGKRRTLPVLSLFFLCSSRPPWQQLKPADCCCLLAEWIFWTSGNPLPVLHLHISLPPSLRSSWLLQSVYLIPLSWFTLLRQTHSSQSPPEIICLSISTLANRKKRTVDWSTAQTKWADPSCSLQGFSSPPSKRAKKNQPESSARCDYVSTL